ncbi:uncharacterized protein METZ01_LOCUS354375 [marine metagenome]|uniref:Uncharacterized protein n=1 Tax=marine metagenome TaxID=408172 RepID=A0A382RXZ6_9ZZZZ
MRRFELDFVGGCGLYCVRILKPYGVTLFALGTASWKGLTTV